MIIGGREIGIGRDPYVIAEIGVNHDGDVGRALQLIEAARTAGADAVKFQFFETDRLMSSEAKLAAYQRTAGEVDPVQMLRRLELRFGELRRCVEHAKSLRLGAIVSVFSFELVDLVAGFGVDALKSASPDVINKPLLREMVGTGLPMIVSTGAAELDEVERAVGWIADADASAMQRLALLQCVSAYPTRCGCEAFAGIGALGRLCPVTGYSDHTSGVSSGADAVGGFGAAVLEKHLTYDTRAAGPDHAASLDGPAFAEYARRARLAGPVRAVVSAGGEKRVLECELDVRDVSRQSVVSRREIVPGEVIGADALTVKRPGGGLEPWELDGLVGKVARRSIAADVRVERGDFAAEAAAVERVA